MIAVILAAGLSKRFGGKKLLERIQKQPMVLHITNMVCALDFEQKVFVYSDEEVLNVVKNNCEKASDLKFLFNGRAKEGLSTSIKLAIENIMIPEEESAIIFFVADQPFLDKTTVNRLMEAFYERKGSIIVPLYFGNRGNPVIFSTKWIEQLKNIEGDVGGREIIRQNHHEVFEIYIEDGNLGRDIDTKEEYKVIQGERNTDMHE